MSARTALAQAQSRGHDFGEPEQFNDLHRWECRRCYAAVLVDNANPHGFGSALERDCLKDVAA